MSLSFKHKQLIDFLSKLDAIAIAYSGGVDSALLLKLACDCLGAEKVIALTATAPILPDSEAEQGRQFAAQLGVTQHFIHSNALTLNDFVENSDQRCYHCKYNIFSLFLQHLKKPYTLLDGSNFDDLDEYRPGREALNQLKICSPLADVKMTKAEVRELSQQLKLSTWNKVAFSCLATRIPYGTKITAKRLQQIDNCENWLRQQGFNNYRVRHHGQLAQIEVEAAEINKLTSDPLRQQLIEVVKGQGFNNVSVDLQGYRKTL